MAQLVLLVLAAVWMAVLIPPLLRSRVENRPNSSVTDFRRQLTKLQNTATPARGAVRAIGRPLTQSPVARPVGPARSGQPTLRSGLTRRPSPSELAAHRSADTSTVASAPAMRRADPPSDAPGFRTHGDPSGGHRRPPTRHLDPVDRTRRAPRTMHHETGMRDDVRRRAHGDPSGPHRRADPSLDPRTAAKRRRTNVLFALVVSTACALFLAATTASDVLWWLFVATFAGLCTYVYLLAQVNQRTGTATSGAWAESY